LTRKLLFYLHKCVLLVLMRTNWELLRTIEKYTSKENISSALLKTAKSCWGCANQMFIRLINYLKLRDQGKFNFTGDILNGLEGL
jgi:hypothetical protein